MASETGMAPWSSPMTEVWPQDDTEASVVGTDLHQMYHSWAPDTDGRWRSQEIDVAFGLEGSLATVYTRDGRRMLHEGEVEMERARARAEVVELRHLLDGLRERQP